VYALHSQIHSPIFCPNGKKIVGLHIFSLIFIINATYSKTTSAQNYLKGPENIYKNIYRYIFLNDEQNGSFFMKNPCHVVQVFKGAIHF
jgi:hypothetical protein